MALTSNLPDFSLAPQEYITQVCGEEFVARTVSLFSFLFILLTLLQSGQRLPKELSRWMLFLTPIHLGLAVCRGKRFFPEVWGKW